jgi:hypothetical protein
LVNPKHPRLEYIYRFDFRACQGVIDDRSDAIPTRTVHSCPTTNQA